MYHAEVFNYYRIWCTSVWHDRYVTSPQNICYNMQSQKNPQTTLSKFTWTKYVKSSSKLCHLASIKAKQPEKIETSDNADRY